ELVARVERTADRTDALTAARAVSLALFRELFGGEGLAAGRLGGVAGGARGRTDGAGGGGGGRGGGGAGGGGRRRGGPGGGGARRRWAGCASTWAGWRRWRRSMAERWSRRSARGD